MKEEISKRQTLLDEIKVLKSQLEESAAGLLAATRISNQLESAQISNTTIRDECKYSFYANILEVSVAIPLLI